MNHSHKIYKTYRPVLVFLRIGQCMQCFLLRIATLLNVIIFFLLLYMVVSNRRKILFPPESLFNPDIFFSSSSSSSLCMATIDFNFIIETYYNIFNTAMQTIFLFFGSSSLSLSFSLPLSLYHMRRTLPSN